MPNIISIDGWALDAIASLDEVQPGFAGAYLRASNKRRQVIAAFLAASPIEHGEQQEIAAFLAGADHNVILTRGFGHTVTGLRKALGKSGAKPHEPEYYQKLVQALTQGPRHVITAIKRVETLDTKRLGIIEMLPSDLCDSRIVMRLERRSQATDLVTILDFMVSKGLDRSSIISALLKSTSSIQSVIQRWSLRLPFPAPPIPASGGHRPIRSGRQLREAALRYQNCSRRYIMDSLAGEHAFGEYTLEDGRQVLICYARHDGIWHLDGAYARRNRQIAEEVNEAVRQFTSRHGIVVRRALKKQEDGISALRRFNSSIFDW